MNPDTTPNDLRNMKDKCVIYAMIEQTGGKPVVVLYPPHDNFSVKKVGIKLNHNFWRLNGIYPTTNRVTSNEVIWEDMKVNKDGTIYFNEETSTNNSMPILRHEYLFWESKTVKNEPFFEFSEAGEVYLLSRENVCEFLIKNLSSMGLKSKEVNNFVTFWMNGVMEKDHVLIQFMSKEVYEKLIRLDVRPQPNRTIKVFMLFHPLDRGGVNQISPEKRRLVKNLVGSRRMIEGKKWELTVRKIVTNLWSLSGEE